MATVSVQSVVAGYGNSEVLHDISVQIVPGEVLAVLGPNGSGKSTLVRCISRTLRPTSGSISIDGENIDAMTPKQVARRVAVVPQQEDSIFEFTAREVVEMGRFAHDGADLKQVDGALMATACEDIAHRPVTQLSGGERQRVLLARALAQDTPVILLDEPTAHMDVGYQIATLSHLRNLSRTGRAIVAVLHDLNLAAGFADRALLMHAGRIELDASVDEVLESDQIDRVYGAKFNRMRDPFTGRVVLTPEFIPERKRTAKPRRIHIVGGGGSAAALITELWQIGHELSLGVALELDSDLDAAHRLRIPAVTVPPFSTISMSDVESGMKMALDAHVIIVCPAPYGKGNLANLDLVERLSAAGKPVIWLDWTQQPWDFTGGEAGQKADHIRSKNGVLCVQGDVAESIERLP